MASWFRSAERPHTDTDGTPQYGSRAGVWRILRLFKEYGVKCTSYMVGQALLMNPDVGRVMVQEGHEVAR